MNAAEPLRRARRVPDPDPDGVALAATVALGVLAGARLPAWLAGATAGLAATLAATLVAVAAKGPGRGLVARGVLVLVALAASGAAVAGVRAVAVQRGVLPSLAGRVGMVTVEGRLAEEPRPVGHGGRRVVVSVRRVAAGGRAWRTRERAAALLAREAGPLSVGDRVRLRAGLEPAPRADRLGRLPPVALRRPVVAARAPASGLLLRASEELRAAARARAGDSLPPPRAALLVGLALGDTSLLDAGLEARFQAAGLTHLMAVSGANVGVVLAAGLGLALLAGAGRPLLAGLGIAMVGGFVVLTRWQPSVLRAGVMAGLVLLGLAVGREPGGRRALTLAVALLLLADPSLAGALGFALSVAATAGILWVGLPAARLLPGRLPGWLRAGVGVTVGAQAGAMPVLALALGRLSLAGLPANLLAFPLAGVPMLLGLVAAVLAPVAPWAATLACKLADPFLVALAAIAHWGAGLPGASLTLSGPVRAAPALVVVALAALGARRAGGAGERAGRPGARR